MRLSLCCSGHRGAICTTNRTSLNFLFIADHLARRAVDDVLKCAVRVECPCCGWWRASGHALSCSRCRLPSTARCSAWPRRGSGGRGAITTASRSERCRGASRGVAGALEVVHVPHAYAPSWRVRAYVTAVRVDLAMEFCGPVCASVAVLWNDDPAAVVAGREGCASWAARMCCGR